jgi:hypothetical protein
MRHIAQRLGSLNAASLSAASHAAACSLNKPLISACNATSPPVTRSKWARSKIGLVMRAS